MSKKVRIKELKKNLGVSNVGEMFESIMGIKDADISVIKPKIVAARNLIRRVHRVLRILSQGSLSQDFPYIAQGMREIDTFLAELESQVGFNSADGNETEDTYASYTKETLNAAYKSLKENLYVKQLIALCAKLKQYSAFIDDKENLRDNFIKQEPGLSLRIFDFSTFDLTHLWADPRASDSVKKFILNILHSLWKDLYTLYRLITSPDVDIEKFTSVLIESIASLKKQPALSRCKRAFARIEQSVELLKENFGQYYRDSVSSGNSNIIIENFIIDVSKQGDADARLTKEFSIITQHMYRTSQQNGRNKDPHVKKIFAMLNKNFEIMEQQVPRDTQNTENKSPAK